MKIIPILVLGFLILGLGLAIYYYKTKIPLTQDSKVNNEQPAIRIVIIDNKEDSTYGRSTYQNSSNELINTRYVK